MLEDDVGDPSGMEFVNAAISTYGYIFEDGVSYREDYVFEYDEEVTLEGLMEQYNKGGTCTESAGVSTLQELRTATIESFAGAVKNGGFEGRFLRGTLAHLAGGNVLNGKKRVSKTIKSTPFSLPEMIHAKELRAQLVGLRTKLQAIRSSDHSVQLLADRVAPLTNVVREVNFTDGVADFQCIHLSIVRVDAILSDTYQWQPRDGTKVSPFLKDLIGFEVSRVPDRIRSSKESVSAKGLAAVAIFQLRPTNKAGSISHCCAPSVTKASKEMIAALHKDSEIQVCTLTFFAHKRQDGVIAAGNKPSAVFYSKESRHVHAAPYSDLDPGENDPSPEVELNEDDLDTGQRFPKPRWRKLCAGIDTPEYLKVNAKFSSKIQCANTGLPVMLNPDGIYLAERRVNNAPKTAGRNQVELAHLYKFLSGGFVHLLPPLFTILFWHNCLITVCNKMGAPSNDELKKFEETISKLGNEDLKTEVEIVKQSDDPLRSEKTNIIIGVLSSRVCLANNKGKPKKEPEKLFLVREDAPPVDPIKNHMARYYVGTRWRTTRCTRCGKYYPHIGCSFCIPDYRYLENCHALTESNRIIYSGPCPECCGVAPVGSLGYPGSDDHLDIKKVQERAETVSRTVFSSP